MLSEYPASMIGLNKGDTYIPLMYTNSPGNDILLKNDSNVDECTSLCNSRDDCAGFGIVTNPDNSIDCWLKNNGMYSPSNPTGLKMYYPDTDLYVRNPLINNSASCSKNIENIDSIEWQKYNNSGIEMMPSTLCGLQNATHSDLVSTSDKQQQLGVVAQQIVNKINKLSSLNSNMNSQMKVDESVLANNLTLYNKISNQYQYVKNDGSNNINGILDDSKIIVSSENYNYIFWGCLAMVFLIVIFVLLKKNT